MTHRVALGSSVALLLIAAFVPLLWWQQPIYFAVLAVTIGLWCWKRHAESRLLSLFLAFLSACASVHYLLWRGSTVAGWLRQTEVWSLGHVVTVIAQLPLLAAEVIWVVEISLGYLQTAWPLRRPPVPLSPHNEFWPPVEVLLKTRTEPLAMVKAAAFAALNLDWPAEKLSISVWDQGCRAKVEAFCEQTGIRYVAEEANGTAGQQSLSDVAGLSTTPYVALFDVQQPPVRSFLQLTVGWLERDRNLAFVQTKGTGRTRNRFAALLNSYAPAKFFVLTAPYQDGRDLWDSTSFEGAAAILRREVLTRLESSKESTDLAKSNLTPLQNQGWRTAYLAVAQAALRADREDLGHAGADHVEPERRANVQPRDEMPTAQRVLVFYTRWQSLFVRSRIVFLLAPSLALLFGLLIIPGRLPELLGFAIPHLTLAAITRARLEGWSLLTDRAPNADQESRGESKMQKGQTDLLRREPQSQAGDLRFFLFLLVNIVAVTAFGIRLVLLTQAVPPHRALIQESFALLCISAGWAVVNIVLIGAANARAPRPAEARRKSRRTDVSTHVSLTFADGTSISGFSSNASTGGMLVRVAEDLPASHGQNVTMRVAVLDASISVPATIVAKEGLAVHLQFRPRTPEQEEAIAVLLYSRADAWLADDRQAPESVPVMLVSALKLAWRGWSSAVQRQSLTPPERTKENLRFGPVWAALVAVPLVSVVVALSVPLILHSRVQRRTSGISALDTSHAGNGLAPLVTSDLASRPVLITVDAPFSQSFSIPQTEVARKAALRVRCKRSERLRADGGLLLVELNDTEVARLPLGEGSAASSSSLQQIFSYSAAVHDAVLTVALPPELVVSTNHLALRLQLSGREDCQTLGCRPEWLRLEPGSLLEVSTMPLHSRFPSKVKSIPFRAPTPEVLPARRSAGSKFFQVQQTVPSILWAFSAVLLCLVSARVVDRSLRDQARRRLEASC